MTSSKVSTVTTETDEVLLEVHLLRYPLRLGMRASEHYEDVFREFALLAAAEPRASDSVPTRLLALVDTLGRRYARQQHHEEEREQAFLRGETCRDMTILMPAPALEAARELDAMLDEADDFCRDGALLTLAPAADVVAFRRWYLRECVEQVAGGAASPWPGELS